MLSRYTFRPATLLLIALIPQSTSGQLGPKAENPFRNLDVVALLNGYVPTPTRHVLLVKEAVCSGDGGLRLLEWYRDASPEGRALLLYGIFQCDKDSYRQLRDRFLAEPPSERTPTRIRLDLNGGKFEVMEGMCTPRLMTKQELIDSIENGHFDHIYSLRCR